MPVTPSRISRDELISYLTSYSSRVMPGFLNILNKLFTKQFGTDMIDLFLNDPPKVYNTLLNMYGNEDTATLIIAYLLVKPILIRLERLDLMDKAIALATKDPDGFKKLLRSLDVDL